MNDNFQFHYLDVEQKDCIPFVIHIENIAATVVRGHHLKRQTSNGKRQVFITFIRI